MLNKLKELISYWFINSERKRIEIYLSKATDIYQLEYMQKDLERKGYY